MVAVVFSGDPGDWRQRPGGPGRPEGRVRGPARRRDLDLPVLQGRRPHERGGDEGAVRQAQAHSRHSPGGHGARSIFLFDALIYMISPLGVRIEYCTSTKVCS